MMATAHMRKRTHHHAIQRWIIAEAEVHLNAPSVTSLASVAHRKRVAALQNALKTLAQGCAGVVRCTIVTSITRNLMEGGSHSMLQQLHDYSAIKLPSTHL